MGEISFSRKISNHKFTNKTFSFYFSFAYNSDSLHTPVFMFRAISIDLIFHISCTTWIDNNLQNKARMPRQTIPLSLQFNWFNAYLLPSFKHCWIMYASFTWNQSSELPILQLMFIRSQSMKVSSEFIHLFVCLQKISVFFHCPKYGKLAILLFVFFFHVFVFYYFSYKIPTLSANFKVFFFSFKRLRKIKFNAKLNRGST